MMWLLLWMFKIMNIEGIERDHAICASKTVYPCQGFAVVSVGRVMYHMDVLI